MCARLLLAIFVLFSTYFNKSQSVSAATTRVATATTKSRIETKMVKNEAKKGGYQGNRSSGNQGWIPPTSELTNVTFNYGTRMKTGDFKRSVSLIAGVVAKGIKHGIKDVVKACNTGKAPTNAEPTEPAIDASERLEATYS